MPDKFTDQAGTNGLPPILAAILDTDVPEHFDQGNAG